MKRYLSLLLLACLALSGCSAKLHEPSTDYRFGLSSKDSSGSNNAPNDWEGQDFSSESYLAIEENKDIDVSDQQMLTFSLKVDTAAYTNVKRYLESGNLPPADAVRTEEMLNYFRYGPEPVFDGSPFFVSTEVAPSPFKRDKYVALVHVKTEDVKKDDLSPSNLTFLIDSSGSMSSYDKLPLLKKAFGLLVETLGEDDRVSIVTYAGSSAVVLDSVSGDNKRMIIDALDHLESSGSTAGGQGIQTAYALAEKNFLSGGNNRVILATDGDFNVGVSSNQELGRLITQKRESGIYLSILGFGTGNIRDDLMETLSKDGNGNYSYIDSLSTANKALVEEMGSNMFTVADDVKAQIEFNPKNIKSYRLIGYENRRMANSDFKNDRKDAGEVGVGTSLVVMFEIELAESGNGTKYAPQNQPDYGDELFEVRIRYKNPGESESRQMNTSASIEAITSYPSGDFNLACSVAAFADLLRGSSYAEGIRLDTVISLAAESLENDENGYRRDYVELLKAYGKLPS